MLNLIFKAYLLEHVIAWLCVEVHLLLVIINELMIWTEQ